MTRAMNKNKTRGKHTVASCGGKAGRRHVKTVGASVDT